jgi:hypothetical protein
MDMDTAVTPSEKRIGFAAKKVADSVKGIEASEGTLLCYEGHVYECVNIIYCRSNKPNNYSDIN